MYCTIENSDLPYNIMVEDSNEIEFHFLNDRVFNEMIQVNSIFYLVIKWWLSDELSSDSSEISENIKTSTSSSQEEVDNGEFMYYDRSQETF